VGVPGVEFGRFAARVVPSLVRCGYLLTGDRGHAEDLAQVTLWRTARRWGELSGSPDAYAHEVLVNLSRDRRRSLTRRPLEVAQLDLVVDRGYDATEALLERNAVVQAVRGLPRRQREVVVLRFFLDSFGRAGRSGFGGLGRDDQVLHGPGDRAVACPVERRPDCGARRAIGGSEC
jgi:RNA polymerase sigma factor (sigma-70 family)